MQRLETLPTTRVNYSGAMKRGWDAERIPGTVGVVVNATDSYVMLGGDARERRRHPDSDAIWFKEKEATGAQSSISFFCSGGTGAHLLRYFLQQRRTT